MGLLFFFLTAGCCFGKCTTSCWGWDEAVASVQDGGSFAGSGSEHGWLGHTPAACRRRCEVAEFRMNQVCWGRPDLVHRASASCWKRSSGWRRRKNDWKASMLLLLVPSKRHDWTSRQDEVSVQPEVVLKLRQVYTGLMTSTSGITYWAMSK